MCIGPQWCDFNTRVWYFAFDRNRCAVKYSWKLVCKRVSLECYFIILYYNTYYYCMKFTEYTLGASKTQGKLFVLDQVIGCGGGGEEAGWYGECTIRVSTRARFGEWKMTTPKTVIGKYNMNLYDRYSNSIVRIIILGTVTISIWHLFLDEWTGASGAGGFWIKFHCAADTRVTTLEITKNCTHSPRTRAVYLLMI